jgi:hypothetical protein
LLRLGEIRNPGFEPRRHLPAPFNIDELEPFCVKRPHKPVAFADEQVAILPFQDDEASLGLNDEALAEGLEIMNNRTSEPGIAWTGGNQTKQGGYKDKAPDTERKGKLNHRRSPRNADENGP